MSRTTASAFALILAAATVTSASAAGKAFVPFGDFLAGMYFLEHGNATYQATRRYCIGDWDAVSYNPFTGAANGSGCLRWIDGTAERARATVLRDAGLFTKYSRSSPSAPTSVSARSARRRTSASSAVSSASRSPASCSNDL